MRIGLIDVDGHNFPNIPHVMVYDKQHTKGGDTVRLLQRYVNNRKIFKTIKRFEDYNPRMG